MKIIRNILLISIFILSFNSIKAQNNYNLYEYYYHKFDYLTNANSVVLSSTDNGVSESIPIGFTFQLNGVNYTSLKAYINGFVTLGDNTYSSSGSETNSTNTSFSGFGNADILAPFWCRLIFNDTSSIKGMTYVTTGTAPYRVFTIEWRDVSMFNSSNNSYKGESRYSFRLILFETTNDIGISHIKEYLNNNDIATPTVGIISKSKEYKTLQYSLDKFDSYFNTYLATYNESYFLTTRPIFPVQLDNTDYSICNANPDYRTLNFSIINYNLDSIVSINWYKNSIPISQSQTMLDYRTKSTKITTVPFSYSYTPTESEPGYYYYFSHIIKKSGRVVYTNISGKFTFGNNYLDKKFVIDISGNYTDCNIVKLTVSTGDTTDKILWSGGNSPTSFSNEFTTTGTYSVTVTRDLLKVCNLNSTISKSFNVAINTNINGELLAIYNPNFTANYQGGWQINRDAYFSSNNSNSGDNLILTNDEQYRVGSAFWKRKIALNKNLSFSGYFEFKLAPTSSRADGITFTIQQASNTAGTNGSGMGYLNLPGKSIAIEYDTYDNNSGSEGESNNHIALDVNGEIHNTIPGRAYSYPYTNQEPYVKQLDRNVLDLADGKTKYNWIDYDGSNNVLEVRISNLPIRPVSATMSINNIDLSTIMAGGDVFFGFSGATGLFSEKQSIERFFLRNMYNPFGSNINNCDYKQSTVNINISNSNDINCANPTSILTIKSTDQLGANTSIDVTFSIDQGQAAISPLNVTTNASTGSASVTVSNLTTSNVIIRAVTSEGAFATYTINNLGNIVINGAMSACVSSTVQLSTNDITSGTWSSSNTSIATVNNTGLVTTKNTGGNTLISYTPNGGTDCVVSGNFSVQSINLISPTTAITYNGLNEGVNQIFVTVGQNSGTPKTYKWYRNTTNSKSGATLIATHNNPLNTDIYAAPSNTIGKFFYYCDVDNTNGCTTKSSDFSGVMVVNQRGLNTNGDKILYPTVNYLNANGDFLTTAGVNDQGEKFTINTLPTVTTGAVSNIAPNSFSVNTTNLYDAGMNITEKGFVYSLSSNPTIADSKVVAGTGSSTFSGNISNLNQSTTYYVRPYVTNIYGTFYGNQTTATTISGYRYYKWNITALRDASTAGALQVSEFSFQLNGVDQSWSSVTVTARGDNASATPQAEGIAQLTDGNVSTKWLDFSTSGTPISWIKFDFGAGVYKKFTSYKWYTANDFSTRDPISWTIQGSNDGTNWTTLDTQSNFSVTSTRNTVVGTFTLP